MDICGLREDFSLRKYQAPLVEETLKEFEEKAKQNVFISLHACMIRKDQE